LYVIATSRSFQPSVPGIRDASAFFLIAAHHPAVSRGHR
jgi:hypothetical protein